MAWQKSILSGSGSTPARGVYVQVSLMSALTPPEHVAYFYIIMIILIILMIIMIIRRAKGPSAC